MKYFIKQLGTKDCGVTCIKMLLAILNKNADYLYYSQINTETSSTLRDLIKIAKKEGVILKSSRFIEKEDLFKEKPKCPFLLIIRKDEGLHMILIRKITKNKIKVYDPNFGIYWLKKEALFKIWNGEILEVSNFKHGNFKLKKLRVFPKPFIILTIGFQILSIVSLILATLFIDKNYSFLVSLSLFFGYIVFELIYQKIIISSLKYFDNCILVDNYLSKREDFKNYFEPMNKFKYLLVSTPLTLISSFFMLTFGCILLLINNYWSFIILISTFIVQIVFKYLDDKYFKNKRVDLENLEKTLFNSEIEKEDEFKDKVLKMNEETYEYVNFSNFKRYFLVFFTISMCLIYLGFTGNISINFLFFHFFLFAFMQEEFIKLLNIGNNIEALKHYKCLYFYHFY